ncbi:MAG: DUF4340 domain-containing protein [Candidatus Marinimicrobia bacterium]|nr:DUF4340 domain-containing protein [Candidatus Neomarinimicrobiota bacterium]MCF7828958.1 DUF4340 domain-containing protein [Candidatus Neomarinimicrobiota bacterium]MCF7879918.1 DUF4340 domain-containing protein [Candidatus Neomarinimicrobiota bacterium]
MKPKTTLTLLGLLAVLGLFYYFWGVKGAAEREQQEQIASRIINIEPDSVSRVTLTQGENILQYERIGGQWKITEPVETGANQSRINTNLDVLTSVEKNRTVATDLTDLQPYGLDSPSAKVQIVYNDTGSTTLLVGDQNPTQSGTFVKLTDAPGIYTTANAVRTQAQKTLFELRDKTILDFERSNITKFIVSRDDGRDLTFNKSGSMWRLDEPQIRVNSSKVTGLLSSVDNGTAQEYYEESPENLREYGLNNPQASLSVFSNDSTRDAVLAVGDQVPNSDPLQYYVRDLSRPMVFSVTSTIVDDFFDSVFEFQDKKLFEMNRNQVTDVEIIWNDTTYQVTKIDTTWQLNSPVVAPANGKWATTIARTISNLRMDSLGSYTNTNPARYGLDDPWLRMRFNIAGSEFDGLTVGDETGERFRYIKMDSSPYIYVIRESKLSAFQVSLDELRAKSADMTLESE